MKKPAPRGIGVAGEEGDTKSDRRILNALRFPMQPCPKRLGEITTDIVVATAITKCDVNLSRGRDSMCA